MRALRNQERNLERRIHMNVRFSLFCIHNIIYNRLAENESRSFYIDIKHTLHLARPQARLDSKLARYSRTISTLTRTRYQRHRLDRNYKGTARLDSSSRNYRSMTTSSGNSARSAKIRFDTAGTRLEGLARAQRAASLSRRARFVSCARVQESAKSRGLRRVAESMSASSQRASSSHFSRSEAWASSSRPKLPGLRSRLPGSHPRSTRSHRGEIQPDLIVYIVSRQLEVML